MFFCAVGRCNFRVYYFFTFFSFFPLFIKIFYKLAAKQLDSHCITFFDTLYFLTLIPLL